jgi:integrase
MDIRDPSPTNVGRWVRSLTDRCLSPKTVRNHHGIAHSLFQAALEHEPVPMCSANPCGRTRLPEVVQEEMRFLTHQQFDRLLNAAPDFYKPVLTTLVGTSRAGTPLRHQNFMTRVWQPFLVRAESSPAGSPLRL